MGDIELNDGQLEALSLARRRHSLALLGLPGTGKSTCLDAIVQEFCEEMPYVNIAVTATTGCACNRLCHDHPQTVHR